MIGIDTKFGSAKDSISIANIGYISLARLSFLKTPLWWEAIEIHKWFIVLLQYLPVIQQSVIVVSFRSHHKMNPCKQKKWLELILKTLKMRISLGGVMNSNICECLTVWVVNRSYTTRQHMAKSVAMNMDAVQISCSSFTVFIYSIPKVYRNT